MPVVSARQCFLDTFDWRVFTAGFELRCVVVTDGCHLRLIERSSGATVRELRVEEPPAMAEALPSGPFRDQLSALTDGRSLLCRGVTTVRWCAAELRNAHGRMIARLELSAEPRRRGAWLELDAMRGFEKEARREAKRLRGACDGVVWRGDHLRNRTVHEEPGPGRYPGWRDVRISEPGLRSDQSLLAVLAHYTKIMALNLPGARESEDPEFLHEFRIGLRRCRTVLKRVPGVFAPARTARFLQDFATWSALTGWVRDLDVHALELPRQMQVLPDSAHADAEALMALVGQRRAQAHEALQRALSSAPFRRRFAAWEQFVTSPPARTPIATQALQPAYQNAEQVLAKMARKVYRRGDEITSCTADEAYHELRKTCKNLRYLYDVYDGLMTNKHSARVRKRLRSLQDVLGAHQDYAVQAATLTELITELGLADNDVRHAALVALIEDLRHRSSVARAEFARHYPALRAMKLNKFPLGD